MPSCAKVKNMGSTILYILFWVGNYRLRGHNFFNPIKDMPNDFDTPIRKFLDIITGKTPLAIYMLLVTWFLFGLIPGLIVGIGYRLEVMLGIGLYFRAFDGDLEGFCKRDYNNVLIRKGGKVILDDEIKLIDMAADKISSIINGFEIRSAVEYGLNHGGINTLDKLLYTNASYRWGFIAMTLRALLILPVFIALSSYTGQLYIALLAGISVALAQGFTYYKLRGYYADFKNKWDKWFYGGKNGQEPPNKTVGFAELYAGLYRGIAFSSVLLLMG